MGDTGPARLRRRSERRPTVINASGTLTRLGGSRMAPEVLAAMAEAAASFVPIDALQARAGEIIAEHTGAESGYVVTGAAAGLSLGVAACVAGFDVAAMDRLPDTTGLRNEVVVQRGHRNAYDHAIRAAGARIVDIGNNDRGTGAGVRGIEGWEIENAITPRSIQEFCFHAATVPSGTAISVASTTVSAASDNVGSIRSPISSATVFL